MERRKEFQKEAPVICWEGEDIAVLSKPRGWVCALSRDHSQNHALKYQNIKHFSVEHLVESGKTEHLAHWMQLKYGRKHEDFQIAGDEDYEYGICHRLDVDTSGALVIAKHKEAFKYMRAAFNCHDVYKEYICLCHGFVKELKMSVDSKIYWNENNNMSYIDQQKGQWAKSIVNVMGRYCLKGNKVGKIQHFTLCRVVIVTGRTHQIRVHMASVGHPLVSDPKYHGRMALADLPWCPRTFLHAWRIGFWDMSKVWRDCKAPLAKDLARSLTALDAIRIDSEAELNGPSVRVLPQVKVSPLPAAPPKQISTQLDPSIGLPPISSDRKKSEYNQQSNKQATNYTTNSTYEEYEKQKYSNYSKEYDLQNYAYDRESQRRQEYDYDQTEYSKHDWDTNGQNYKKQDWSYDTEYGKNANGKNYSKWDYGNQNWDYNKKDSGYNKKDWSEQQATDSWNSKAELEEACSKAAMQAILNAPKCKAAIGDVGKDNTVWYALQEFGTKRPKLSKILQDRPDLFVFVGSGTSAPLVTLTQEAMTMARRDQINMLAEKTNKEAANAADDAWKEREKLQTREAMFRSDLPSTPSKQKKNRGWGQADDVGPHQKILALVEMGFEQQYVERALRASKGNFEGAMALLAREPASRRKEVDPHENDEEEALRRAIEQSMREEEEKKNAFDDDDDDAAFERALRESMQDTRSPNGNRNYHKETWSHYEHDNKYEQLRPDEEPSHAAEAPEDEDEEEMLKRALALSEEEEELRKQMDDLESGALAQALKSSKEEAARMAAIYQDGDADFEEILRLSRLETGPSYRDGNNDRDEMEEALRRSAELYEMYEKYDGTEEFDDSFMEMHDEEHWGDWGGMDDEAVDDRVSDMEFAKPLRNGGYPSSSGMRSDQTCTVADSSMASSSHAASSSSCQAPPPIDTGDSDDPLKGWVKARVKENNIEIDPEMLWNLLDSGVMDEDALSDPDTLKLWLGFHEQEELPQALPILVCQFRQQKQWLRVTSPQGSR